MSIGFTKLSNPFEYNSVFRLGRESSAGVISCKYVVSKRNSNARIMVGYASSHSRSTTKVLRNRNIRLLREAVKENQEILISRCEKEQTDIVIIFKIQGNDKGINLPLFELQKDLVRILITLDLSI